MACVSCSLFPKRELNGTGEEKPKPVQQILSSLSTVNATIEILYGSVTRGLDENGQKAVDLFVLEGAAKKKDPKEQVDLIKTGLEIIVDLKSSRVEAPTVTAAITALRRTIQLFDLSTLRFLQDIGRSTFQASLQLAGDLGSVNNNLARSLFTLAAIVERSGVPLVDGTFAEIQPETLAKGKELELKLVKTKIETFLVAQPFLFQAVNLESKLDPAKNTSFEQSEFTISAVTNGLSLATALQTQKDSGLIDKTSFANALRTWSGDVKIASTAVAAGETPPVLVTIPETVPKLDSKTGALPDGLLDWNFTLAEKPTQGSVDLTKNPPVFVPANTFGSLDRYSFRACQKAVASFCTETFVVVVARPATPSAVTLRTVSGESFARGREVICESTLESATLTSYFEWYFQPAAGGNPTLLAADASKPGRLKLNNLGTGDRLSCKVRAVAANGLMSSAARDSAALVAANSVPSDIIVTPVDATSYNEFVSGDPVQTYPRKIATVTIVDDDPGETAVVSALSDEPCALSSSAYFGIANLQQANKTADLMQKAAFDFESKPSYDFYIIASDSAAGSYCKKITINVTDRNDPISDIKTTPSSISIQENNNAANQIALLSADDQDCTLAATCQANYSYSFVTIGAQGAEQDSSYFSISGRSLKSKQPLDYEQKKQDGTLHGPVYTLIVRATDPQGGFFDKTITVTVNNVYETPSDIILSNNAVTENQLMGTEVGTLSTTDIDAGDVFTYTLSGTTDLAIAGNKIVSTKPLDYETTPSYQIMVTSTDLGGNQFTKAFTINVLNVNDAPLNIQLSKLTIQEKRDPAVPAELAEVQIVLTTDDPDTADFNDQAGRFSYVIDSINNFAYNANDSVNFPFEIVGRTLRPKRVLLSSNPADLSYSIKITSTDIGGLSVSNTFTLSLSAVVLTALPVKENEVAADIDGQRKVVGQLSTLMPGVTGAREYSLASQPSGNYFKVIGDIVYAIKSFDYEVKNSYELTIKSQNPGGANALVQKFTILIQDENDQPGEINFDAVFFVQDENLGNELLGNLSSLDQDGNETMTWGILAENNPQTGTKDYEAFTVTSPTATAQPSGGTRLETQLRVAAGKVFDINMQNKYVFTVFGINSRSSKTFTVFKTLTFEVVSAPKLVLANPLSPGMKLHADTEIAGQNGLQFDIKITDATKTTTCTKSTGSAVGLKISANDNADVLPDAGISLSNKGYVGSVLTCGVTLVPASNAAGNVNLGLKGTSTTALGSLTSKTELSVPIAFWRKPELHCPKRLTLPLGSTYSKVLCDVRFSDGFAQSKAISISGASSCGASWDDGSGDNTNIGTISGKVGGASPAGPSEACQTNIVASGTNTLGVTTVLNQTLDVIPRKFSTNGSVKAIAKDSSGNVVLGGSFSAVNPFASQGWAAVNANDGSVATSCNFTEGFNGRVKAVAYDSGSDSFWLGGDFTEYRGYEAKRIIRLSCAGEIVRWFPNKGFDGSVNAIALAADGSVFIGGSFRNYGTSSAKGLVRLNGNGVLQTSYDFSGTNALGSVNALAVTTSTSPPSLWVGGSFSSYGSDATAAGRANLVRINFAGDAQFVGANSGVNSAVSALSVVSGGVVAGGSFSSYRGVAAKRIAFIKDDGSLDNNSFDVSSGFAGGNVSSIVSGGGSLFVGGSFFSYRGVSARYLVKVNLPGVSNGGDRDTGFSIPTLDKPVNALLFDSVDSQVIVGGQFTSASAASRAQLLALNATNGSLKTFNTSVGFNAPVLALAAYASGSKILVAGEFSAFDGTSANRLARFAATGAFDQTFASGIGSGFNGDVEAFLADGTDLFVGGQFTQFKGAPKNRIVKLNANGSEDTSFDVSTGFADGTVKALSKGASGLYVAGSFTSYAGNSAPRLVRLRLTAVAGSPEKLPGSLDSDFEVGNGFASVAGAGSPTVNALVVSSSGGQDVVYAAGEFDQYSGDFYQRIVKLDSTGAPDSAFSAGTLFNAPLFSLSLNNSALYVGGAFTASAGQNAARLVRLNAASAAVTKTFNINDSVRAIVSETYSGQNGSSTRTWVAGSFSAVDGTSSGPLVMLDENDTLSNGFVSTQTSLGALSSATNTFGIYSLLRASETVNSNPLDVIYAGGVFSLFKGASANSLVRVNLGGAEATAP